MRVETIGSATLYLGDARDILPTLERPDAILSDPPYGQGLKLNTYYAGGTRETAIVQRNGKALKMTPNLWPETLAGDNEPFDPIHILEAADKVLLWGAHKFGDRLPRGRWLGWDKVPTGKQRDQGDGELAWTNVLPDAPFRLYRLLWDGLCVGKGARHEVTSGQKRLHPTQKPEAVIDWCWQFLDLSGDETICDPYMGSGTAGVIAARLGHPFVGVELEPLFFETACRRIEDAQRQYNLFGNAA